MAKAKKDSTSSAWVMLGVARIALGFILLWAFVDKLFGLGVATPSQIAWVNGGSPTAGFLARVEGPFSSFFTGLAGQAWVDWLFMLGLLGIGLGLVLGIAVRLAAVTGIVLMLLMWLASFPLVNNPFVDDHVIYALLLGAFALGLSQQRLSLQGWWRSLPFVKKNQWLW